MTESVQPGVVCEMVTNYSTIFFSAYFDEYFNLCNNRVGSHVVFAWIHCTDVRIHCTDILIECR